MKNKVNESTSEQEKYNSDKWKELEDDNTFFTQFKSPDRCLFCGNVEKDCGLALVTVAADRAFESNYTIRVFQIMKSKLDIKDEQNWASKAADKIDGGLIVMGSQCSNFNNRVFGGGNAECSTSKSLFKRI